MANFFDMFKAAPAAPIVPTNPEQPQGIHTPGNGLSAPNQNGEEMPEGTPTNPLDEYKKMFDNSVKSSDLAPPSFKIDPEVLTKVSGGMDFTKGIDPELMQKALTGDAKSLMDVIQSVGRNSYRSSLEHSASITDAHLTDRAAFDQQRVDKGVKSQLTQSALSSAPNYSHPVVKAELNRIADSYARANPDARPAEVAEAAQKYMMDLQAAMSPQSQSSANGSGKAGETDWTSYLSSQ